MSNILIFPFAKKMRNGKQHPKDYPWWDHLIQLLYKNNHTIIQVGVEGETQLIPDFRKELTLGELSKLIIKCDTWIGVDSFGQHLCWDLGKKGIVLWGQSDPNIFGHPENVNLLKDRKYLRERQYWLWEQIEANNDAFVKPRIIVETVEQLLTHKNTTDLHK